MFQVFHMDVAYVTVALPACFKRIFQVFHMFQTYVASISSRDVAYVVMSIHACFKHMFQVFHLFSDMMQMFRLDVSKVNRGVARRRWLADSDLPQPCDTIAGA
jgi:dolichyl-phosphate-mannose--protein O-mannosyl transferase